MSEIYCANCKFYDNEGHCSNPEGLLHGIRISDAMAEAEHDCAVFEEAVYVLGVVGHLDLALQDEGIELDSATVKRVCDSFFKRMIDAGMLKEGGNSDGED